MIYARNEELVKSTVTNPPYVPDTPISKLSVQVLDNDVLLQVTEDENQPPAFTNANETEMLLGKGFHTRVPVTAWTGFRFRTRSSSLTARVTFTAYA